jgi:hypothetical protein
MEKVWRKGILFGHPYVSDGEDSLKNREYDVERDGRKREYAP